MQFSIPFDVEVRAKASSDTSRETIQRRLDILAGMPDSEDKTREVSYLRGLLERKRG